MSKGADIFDPADVEVEIDMANGETGELLPEQSTPEEAFIPDTIGDPEGSENRATQDDIVLPDYFYKKFQLDNEGNPTFNATRVVGIMQIFNDKYGTPMVFNKEDSEIAEKEQAYFDGQVESIYLGLQPLLEVEPQATGINFLQLATRTWAEFSSIVFEYKESMAESDPTKEIPDWLIEREDKMIQLGRKSRLLSSVLDKIDDKFGLKDVSIKADRVKTQVELRLQRLAEWNYKNIVDTSKFSARAMTSDANTALDISDVA
tara:strand:+ start:465 stop:1247 length:783 start_codon:yes stop_codon:yes gene_type:complete